MLGREFGFSSEGAGGGGGFGGGGLAKDKEFDEGSDEDYDGQLAEEEAFGERESGEFIVRVWSYEGVGSACLHTMTAAVLEATKIHLSRS